MEKKYTKKENILVLRHDVILGSTYELQEVDVDVTSQVGGGESMMYESSVVIPIGKPDANGDAITREAIQESKGIGLTIRDHVIGDEKVVVAKNKHKKD